MPEYVASEYNDTPTHRDYIIRLLQEAIITGETVIVWGIVPHESGEELKVTVTDPDLNRIYAPHHRLANAEQAFFYLSEGSIPFFRVYTESETS